MKNYEQMQDEQVDAQFPQPRGVVILEIEDDEEEDLGEGKDNFFWYNFGQLWYYDRDYTNATLTCSYCKKLDHTIEENP